MIRSVDWLNGRGGIRFTACCRAPERRGESYAHRHRKGRLRRCNLSLLLRISQKRQEVTERNVWSTVRPLRSAQASEFPNHPASERSCQRRRSSSTGPLARLRSSWSSAPGTVHLRKGEAYRRDSLLLRTRLDSTCLPFGPRRNSSSDNPLCPRMHRVTPAPFVIMIRSSWRTSTPRISSRSRAPRERRPDRLCPTPISAIELSDPVWFCHRTLSDAGSHRTGPIRWRIKKHLHTPRLFDGLDAIRSEKDIGISMRERRCNHEQ